MFRSGTHHSLNSSPNEVLGSHRICSHRKFQSTSKPVYQQCESNTKIHLWGLPLPWLKFNKEQQDTCRNLKPSYTCTWESKQYQENRQNKQRT